MSRKLTLLAVVALGVVVLALAAPPAKPVIINYGTIALPGGAAWQPGLWDLNAGAVTISYKLDLSGAPNVAFDWKWNNAGIVGLRHPTAPHNGAQMMGFLSDWDNRASQFPTYPDFDDTQDLDDKFNLQRFPNPGSYDESMYDVMCDTNTIVSPPVGGFSNYAIWFDRDGVDQWQDDMWGMVAGGTYNTLGVYDVQLLFRKASATKGTACPVFAPSLANSWDASGFGIRTGFYTSWTNTGPQHTNVGLSFDADEAKMTAMQVVVAGNPAAGAIAVEDLVVAGWMTAESGKDLCKNGGWKSFTTPVFPNQGQCISYFVSNRN